MAFGVRMTIHQTLFSAHSYWSLRCFIQNFFVKSECIVVYFVPIGIKRKCVKYYFNQIIFRGCSMTFYFHIFHKNCQIFEISAFK